MSKPGITAIIGAVFLLMAATSGWYLTHREDMEGESTSGIKSGGGANSNLSGKPGATGQQESTEDKRAKQEKFNRLIGTNEWPTTGPEILEYFRFLLDRDPKLALQLFDNASDDGKKQDAASIIASEWFERDPVACLRWIASEKWMLDHHLLALMRMSDGCARVDFNKNSLGDVLEAYSLFVNAMPDPRRKKAVESNRHALLSMYGEKTELALILEEIGRLGLEKEADSLIQGRARSAPDEVVRYYKGSGKEISDQVAAGLVLGRLENHVDQALGYLGEHSWQNDRQLSIVSDSVMERYLNTDSMAASEALTNMEPGRAKDWCIKAMAKWLYKRGEAAAVKEWLPSIRDQEIRRIVEGMPEATR